MSNSGIKISALADTNTIPEGGELAIAVGGNISQTFGATLTALRSALLFENAFDTVANGIKGTSNGDIFFVYSDTSKSHVLGYTNVNGISATALNDDTGTQVRYGTYVSLANGGGNGTGDVSNYIDWTYNDGSAIGGENSFIISTPCLDVKAIWVGGSRQFKSLNFTFDVASQKVTLADTLEGGELVVCEILPTTGSNTVDPDVKDYVNVSWVYNSGSANGGENTITPPYTFQTVPAVYLNGARQVLGYQYTVNGTTSITLASPLKKGDFLQVILGGEETQLVADTSALDQLGNYGQGNQKDLITVNKEGTTLYDLVNNLPYFAGLDLPVNFSNWNEGTTSTYSNVWRWSDGTFWTGITGTLPSKPDIYTMHRYNAFSDPENIKIILASIFFQDRTSTAGTLWQHMLSGLTQRIPVAINNTYFSGNGTIELPLNPKPGFELAGLLTWPDYSLSGAPQVDMLSSATASGTPTFANCWNLSTPSALGVSNDTGTCAVWTGVTRAKRLYRLIITTTGHIFIKVMSADLTWGNFYELYSSLNTTKASDGTLSAASPIVRIVDSVDLTERNDLIEGTFQKAGTCGVANDEASGCTVTKIATGTYLITGCKSLAVSGWQVKDPFALQGSSPLGIAEGITQSDGSVIVYLYKRKLMLNSETSEITEEKGDLIDVPSNSWIDVRLTMSDDNEVTEENS